MKNLSLFIFLFFLMIDKSFAGNPSIQVEQSSKPAPMTIEEKKEEYPKYLEDTYIYVRTGTTVGRFPNPDNSLMFSIGLRRLPSSFFYGIDYTTYTSSDKNYEIKSIQGSLGYRIIWNNRFLPYGLIQFGSASFSDKTNTLPNTSGIGTTVDIGIDFVKFNYIKLGTGIRHSNYIFNSQGMSNASFTDLYGVFGIEF